MSLILRLIFLFFICSNAVQAASDIDYVMNQIQSSYMGTAKEEDLISGAIAGIMAKLDPYSSYFSKEELEKMSAESSGEYVGIGIKVSLENGIIIIKEVTENSPAAIAGIRAGDIIQTIDGVFEENPSIDWVNSHISGKLGGTLRLDIKRNDALKTFNIERSLVRIPTVQVTMVNTNIALLKIQYFSMQTLDNLRIAWKSLDKNVRGVILDLRNNSGGLLEQALGVSSAFLEDEVILHIKNRENKIVKTYRATGDALNNRLPVVVLINRFTASGAEILAGALQDNDRALIVGEKSFGKGLMQKIFPLPANGGAIKLTTAEFYTPANKQIQNVGIIPDVEIIEDGEEDRQLEKAKDIMFYLIKMNNG